MTSQEKQLKKSYACFESGLRALYPEREPIMVGGEGNPAAGIVIIGEAPGAEETLQRRPFVGKAGKNLDEILALMRYPRQEVYITNVVKFRPYKVHPKTGSLSNRPPTREEIGQCAHLLFKELSIINPRVVVTLGNTALRTVTDDDKLTIGACHGTLLKPQGAPYTLCPMYHPASVLYNQSLRAVFERDALNLGKMLATLLK